jgi:hypothetical protein
MFIVITTSCSIANVVALVMCVCFWRTKVFKVLITIMTFRDGVVEDVPLPAVNQFLTLRDRLFHYVEICCYRSGSF